MTVVPGEELVRRRAGLARPGYSGPRRNREVPPVAAAFLSAQPMVVVGAADRAGRLWASVLSGPPGFLAGAADRVRIAALPGPGDPLAEGLAAGPLSVGAIALEPASRRRMRMNGTAATTGSGITLELDEVFGNCPKYIQARTYRQVPRGTAATPRRSPGLTLAQQLAVATADTFFVTTADAAGQVDTSHRGGDPGFVRVLGPDRLRFPDYSGNAMFCTLGNLSENPAAGLLFLDWETGTTLQLTGTATTDWDSPAVAELPGAQRAVDFTVTGVLETPGALPLQWSEPEYSKFNPR
ncbi:pyridoxamine 5'-phosphate oxidase family protein [Kitasatospora sp. NPDC058965]|uniref:pyridoxamine 5'-phosphate oxidase family protein n=1 Tax=Kitasatospora sp. NPDC058965 TaxID=3346682 RepID=UPI0036CBB84F